MNKPETLLPVLTAALRRGIQVETHAIGNRGNCIMLDLYQRALVAVPVAERAVAERLAGAGVKNVFTGARLRRFSRTGSKQHRNRQAG